MAGSRSGPGPAEPDSVASTQSRVEDTRLGALLTDAGIVSERDLRHGLEVQALAGGRWPLGQILVEQGFVSQAVLDDLLAIQARLRAGAPRSVEAMPGDFLDEAFLAEAVAFGVTDLLLSEGVRLRMRIAGQLVEAAGEPLAGPELWEFVRRHMGIDALERIAERDSVTMDLRPTAGVRGRISACRHFDGLSIAARLHPLAVRRPEDSGLDERLIEAVRNGRGLVLLAGLAGSGVTETFATLLAAAAETADRSVLVLDRTFEYPVPAGSGALVTRRRIGDHTRDWRSGVRAALREEPDVLFVGDVEPAAFDLAVHAAESGALVVACVRAPSTTAAISRAIGFRATHDRDRVGSALASALLAAVAVRTVPSAAGRAQVLATEMLLPDESIRDLVRSGALRRIRALLRVATGGHSMDASLLALVEAGRARLEDVFPFAADKSAFLEARRQRAGAIA
jgi:twitching motility protein PilT